MQNWLIKRAGVIVVASIAVVVHSAMANELSLYCEGKREVICDMMKGCGPNIFYPSDAFKELGDGRIYLEVSAGIGVGDRTTACLSLNKPCPDRGSLDWYGSRKPASFTSNSRDALTFSLSDTYDNKAGGAFFLTVRGNGVGNLIGAGAEVQALEKAPDRTFVFISLLSGTDDKVATIARRGKCYPRKN